MTQLEKDIFGQRSIFISALLFLMKPYDKDLSFKASLWFLNYHFQLLSLGEVHYSFVIRFIFAGGGSIRESEILSSSVLLVFL